VAVDEGYGDKKYTSFFDCVMFGKTAETVANHSGKGRKVLVEGRIKQERWEKDGNPRSAVRIIVDHVEFLDYKENKDNNGGGQPSSSPGPNDDDAPIDISDDDLPFN
jgi:single-strand DNA-binding protein